MTTPILWYVADPMCSWCWGFAPVIEAIRDANRERMKVALLLGGLRPGTTEPVTTTFRDEILHHWKEVHTRSGQPFRFEGALPDGFVYDTEPPSRAVIAVAELDPSLTYPMFSAIQTAFYCEGLDVTHPHTLANLATRMGLTEAAFLACFDAQPTRDKTQASFQQARRWGVKGFPSLIFQDAKSFNLLANGYMTREEVAQRLDALLG